MLATVSQKEEENEKPSNLLNRRCSGRSWSFFSSITLFVLEEMSSDELTFSWVNKENKNRYLVENEHPVL